MPLPTDCFALTLFLNDTGVVSGSSETYYFDAADHAAALVEAAALANLRAVILRDDWLVTHIRVSKTDISGYSLVSETNYVGQLASDALMEPTAALMLRIEAGPTHRGRKFLHGVVSDLFLPNGDYDGANAAQPDVTIFCNRIKGSGYALATGVDPGPPDYIQVTSAEPQRLVSHRLGRPFGLRRGRR